MSGIGTATFQDPWKPQPRFTTEKPRHGGLNPAANYQAPRSLHSRFDRIKRGKGRDWKTFMLPRYSFYCYFSVKCAWCFCCLIFRNNFRFLCINVSTKKKEKLKSYRARPGFEPGTSRTLSENHTPRPTSHWRLLLARCILSTTSSTLTALVVPRTGFSAAPLKLAPSPGRQCSSRL